MISQGMVDIQKIDGGTWPHKEMRPQFEVFAPAGTHFEPEGLHSLICFSRKDISARLQDATLKPCKVDCDCGEGHAT